MKYTIKNTHLCVTVDTFGAQMVSVKNEKGEELLWQSDKKICELQAPVLFPYTGRIKDGVFHHNGKSYISPIHGFIKDVEHTMIFKEDNLITFEYKSCEESLKKFPFDFVFHTSFILSGHSIHHKIDIKNTGNEDMSFGLGFHPAFKLPFDNEHTTEDYYLDFDSPQSPVVLDLGSDLLLNGRKYVFGQNVKTIPLNNNFFVNDSLIFSSLDSKFMAIAEKDSDRRIEFNIQGFPYITLWSPPTKTMRMFCLEPWLSAPDKSYSSTQWTEKNHAKTLEPGEEFSVLCRMRITV